MSGAVQTESSRRVQPAGAMRDQEGTLMNQYIESTASPFDRIRHARPDGSEYWSARELMPLLGYDRWENFEAAIERAWTSAAAQGFDPADLFRGITKKGAGRPQRDCEMARFACYLVALNGDPRKPEVAGAQSYFIVRTREAETRLVTSMDLTTLDGISAILDAGKAALNRAQAAEARALQLEGPAAERDLYRSSEGLQLIGDVANRFKAYAASRFPGMPVKHDDVWDHAGRLGIVIRGNTVRHNQPTAQAVEAGWATVAETLVETNRHGTVRKVTPRLTPKGEARLWDGLTAYALAHGTLTITKEVAA